MKAWVKLNAWSGRFVAGLIALTMTPGLAAQAPPSPGVADPVVLKLDSHPLPTALLGRHYAETFDIRGGKPPLAFTITGNLPEGMVAIKAPYGILIVGNPQGTGDYPLTLSVKDSLGQTSSGNFTLPVRANDDGNTPVSVNVNETTTTADMVMSGESVQVPLAENVTSTDYVSIVPATWLPLNEAITTTDVVTIVTSLMVPVAENVKTTDTISIMVSGGGGAGGGTSGNAILQISPGTFNILAGQGASYNEGGLASQASTGNIGGVAVDAQGNIYFIDVDNVTVRRIDAQTRIITTVAGTVPAGQPNPGTPATQTSLFSIVYLALDAADNVYISADADAVVYKVTPGGDINVVAGKRRIGECDFFGDNGPATEAAMCGPQGVAVDSTGNLYISDAGNDVIRKVDTTGNITTVAGIPEVEDYTGDGGPATSAALGAAFGIAVDNSGQLYITDSDNNVVRKVDSNGIITTVAGNGTAAFSGDGGSATVAALNQPLGIRVDALGNLFIADSYNQRIRMVDTNGVIWSVAGGNATTQGDGASATLANIYYPSDVALDAAGDLYGGIQTPAIFEIHNPGLVDFGSGHSPLNASQTMILRNTGPGALQFSGAPTVSGMGFSLSAGSNFSCNFTGPLASGGDCLATVNFSGTEPGTYTGTITITDDASNAPQTINLTATVSGRSSITTLQASSNTLVPGNSETLRVTVTGAVSGGPTPTGTITLRNHGSTYATSSLDINGQATFTFTPDAGDYAFKAQYSGDANYAGSTSTAQDVSVTAPVATATLQVSAAALTVGSPETLTVTVSSGTSPTPTGTVTLLNGSTPLTTLTLVNGAAAYTFTPARGTYAFTAQYSGDTAYPGTTSDEEDAQVSGYAASVALTASPTQLSGSDQTITATATVAGNGTTAPTGSLLFFMAGTLEASVPIVNGSAGASFAPSRLGLGDVTVVYIGDSLYESAVSNSVTITAAHGGILTFSSLALTDFAGVPSDDTHGGFSGDGGSAPVAHLNTPAGIAIDSKGNVYIADSSNGVVRRVDVRSNIISTYAGVPYTHSIYSCSGSGDNGPASSAYFCNPNALIFDANDNLYIADYGNNSIRRVDHATQTVTAVVGTTANGQAGFTADGNGHAKISEPIALAFDSSGTLYFAEYGNALVRKLDSSGNLVTVAGRFGSSPNVPNNRQATNVGLYGPAGLAVDASGNIYIADNNLVVKVDNSNLLTYYAGGGRFTPDNGDGGPATSALLSHPQQLTLDRLGNLYIADQGNAVVRRVNSADQSIYAVAGIEDAEQGGYRNDPAGRPATDFPLIDPYAVAMDSSGAFYIADTSAQMVLKAGPNGSVWFPTGQPNASMTVMLTNTGDQPVNFSQQNPYSITGNYSIPSAQICGALLPNDTCPVMINAGSSLPGTGSVTFNTTAVGGQQTLNLNGNPNPLNSSTALTVSGSPANVGDTISFAADVTGAGLPPTGTVSFYDGATLLGSITLASTDSGLAFFSTTSLGAGSHSITAIYAGDVNYTPSVSAVQPAVVNGGATAQTITIGALPTPSYADPSFTVSATSTSGLPVVLAILSGPASGINPFTITGAGTVQLQATQPGSATFAAAAPVTFAVSIAPAPLTIAAGNASRFYGQPNPAFTYTAMGFVRGETPVVLGGAPSLTTSAIGTSAGGTYPIDVAAGTLTAANYSFNFTPGTLTVVAPGPQVILFDRVPPLPVGITFTLTARATSGLPVSYTVTNGTGSATLSNGNKLTVFSPGAFTVTASQPGNANYSAAAPVSQTVNGP